MRKKLTVSSAFLHIMSAIVYYNCLFLGIVTLLLRKDLIPESPHTAISLRHLASDVTLALCLSKSHCDGLTRRAIT